MGEISLPHGREFELELYGVTGKPDEIPAYRDFDSAMREVIATPLVRCDTESGEAERYEPTKPNWGKLHRLWLEVHERLPRRCEGRRSGPLFHFISIGTSLDFHHGVDSFFWWNGVYLSLDASLIPKERGESGKGHLKADILITPDDLTPAGLPRLGEDIARQLKGRRYITRKMNQRKRLLRNRDSVW